MNSKGNLLQGIPIKTGNHELVVVQCLSAINLSIKSTTLSAVAFQFNINIALLINEV
jgi:hypothetical protein